MPTLSPQVLEGLKAAAGDGGGPGVDDEGRLVSPRVRIAALSRDERIQSLGNHLGEVWSR